MFRNIAAAESDFSFKITLTQLILINLFITNRSASSQNDY